MSELRIGMVGAGTMAGAHSAALTNLPHLYPGLALRPRLVAVTDVDPALATGLAERFGYERVAKDVTAMMTADDVDLVVICLPPVFDREIVLAAAAAGKHVVCEKPLGVSADDAALMLDACRRAGVFHGLAAGYRWSPAVRAIGELIRGRQLGTIRSIRASFMLDYAADPDVPLLWRFRKALAGGGIAIDTGYHLVDCARFLVGEIVTIQALSGTFIRERALPRSGATGNRGGPDGGSPAASGGRAATAGGPAAASGGSATAGVAGVPAARVTGPVDVEDAAAALVTFENGAYGVLETSRVAIGKRVSLQIEVYGSLGSADWDLERPDEFRVCLPGDPFTFGFRRVLVNPGHPGAAELLIAGTDGTSIGWLGQECAMWAEFMTAIAEGRPGTADFSDGVRDGAVIDALYASAASGARITVALPAGVA